MKQTIVLLLGLVALLAVTPLYRTAAQEQQAKEADAILGEWLTEEGTSKIEIYKCGDEYCGRICWLEEPIRDGKPRVDEENPEDSLQNRPLMGLTILSGFTYDEDNVWRGGTIYDPKKGKEYTAKMTLVDPKNLDLRGYIGIPLFGRTSKWTRP